MAKGIPPPTMPLAPRIPESTSAMCMEPPLPLQYPVALPNSSASIRSTLAPLAIHWPCPRWVAVIASSGWMAPQAPVAIASSPI